MWVRCRSRCRSRGRRREVARLGRVCADWAVVQEVQTPTEAERVVLLVIEHRPLGLGPELIR
eukprot:5903968-Pyramimonas_sp.AAC.1